MKLVEFFQHWNQQATSCPSLQCLIGQTQVQKPILVVATEQIPDYTSNRVVSSALIAISQIRLSARSLVYTRKNVGRRIESYDPIIYKFFSDFTNHRKKTNTVVVFSCRPLPNILKYSGTTYETFQQSGKQDSLTHFRVQIGWKKVQTQSSSQPPLELKQDLDTFYK